MHQSAHISVVEPTTSDPAQIASALWDNISSVLLGKDAGVRLALVALLSGSHLLIEDVPGVGKTLLAKSLAASIGGSFRRVQATPDLLPSELTGVSVFRPATQDWEFQAGPLFAHVVLVDEINRATPRTQSALLEAMQEGQVTVDGTTFDLPHPFFVVATQNPVETTGTFPLVEGQRDRFGVVLELGLPNRSAERELLLGKGGVDAWSQLRPVTDPTALAGAVAIVERLHCSASVADYVVDIANETRGHPQVALGASPRASLAIVKAAKAHAMLAGREFVSPTDVKAVAAAVLAHRLIMHGGTELATTKAIVNEILDRLAVPRE